MDDPAGKEKDDAAAELRRAMLAYLAGLQQRVVEAMKNANRR